MSCGLLTALLIAGAPARADVHEDRWANLERIAAKEIFQRYELVAGVPRVYVGRKFLGGDTESRQTMVFKVYEYYRGRDAQVDRVEVFDGATGARMGTYTAASGLTLD